MRDKAPAALKRSAGSKLDPYWAELAELRKGGCTLAGLREALASKKVEVSISRLSTYIHHREEARESGGEKIPAAQACMPHGEPDENPLALLLLNQIKAQAGRLGARATPPGFHSPASTRDKP